MIAGVQPCKASSQCFHTQGSSLQILVVDAGNFNFTPCGGFYVFRNLHYIIVIKIKTRHRIIALGMLRLFFDGKSLAVFIKLHYTVLSRISYIIAENRRALFPGCHFLKHSGKALSVKNIVAQNQRHPVITDEIRADDKGVRQSSGLVLNRIGKLHADLAAIA